MKRLLISIFIYILGINSIVVGTGHLTGENGLIRQLRKNGYTVEPVN